MDKNIYTFIGVLSSIYLVLAISAFSMFLTLSMPIMVVLTSVFFALIMVPLYISVPVLIDRYEPEPWSIGLSAFAWGAGGAVVISFIFNTVGGLFLTVLTRTVDSSLSAVLIAPVVEEVSKCFWILIIYLFARKHFNSIIDGVFYAFMVGLGFAATENILYYSQSLLYGQLSDTFITRGLMSPFAHPVFTSMFGISLGLVRQFKWDYTVCLIGLVLSIVLHALWNGSILLGKGGYHLMYVLSYIPALIIIGLTVYVGYKKERSVFIENLDLIDIDDQRVATFFGRIAYYFSGHKTIKNIYNRYIYVRAAKRSLYALDSGDSELYEYNKADMDKIKSRIV